MNVASVSRAYNTTNRLAKSCITVILSLIKGIKKNKTCLFNYLYFKANFCRGETAIIYSFLSYPIC